MSKYETVKKALETNPEVVLVDMILKNYFPERSGYFTQTANIYVAPRQGLFTGEKLQSFMDELIPNLHATSEDSFDQCKDSLEFGKLYFDEKIGEERVAVNRTHIMSDPEFTQSIEVTEGGIKNIYGLNEQGILVQDSNIVMEHRRRTWVRLFPTEQLARDILENKIDTEFSISLKQLESYQPNMLERATANFLGLIKS